MKIRLLIVLALASCGDPSLPEAASARQELGGAPAAKTLNHAWQGQQTGYWCGPASTRIALSTRMTPPTQTTLAQYLGTTTNGTNHIGLIANALNHYLGTTIYSGRNISDPATAAQEAALKQSLVATISNGYPLVANVVSGWRPPGYPGGTIYHYVAVVGYDQDGDRALIADPAGQGAAGGSWVNVPATYWVTTANLAIWIGGKGYAGTGLPINPGTPPSNGTLIGAIYEQGNSANRVAGATVTVAGQSMTTGADGLYQFSLPAGAHTASVSKAGYGGNSVTRTVVAGAQAWGSMEINAQAATGMLKGKIYAFNAANPSDLSQAIAGAVVTVSGQSQTTGADGLYGFTLPGGTVTVDVAKAGYGNGTVTRTVTVGSTIWGSVGLTGTAGPDLQAPQVAISFPANEASLDVAVLQLTGTASDDRGAVASVDLEVNGGAAAVVPVAAGKFAIEVMLRPGLNRMTVTAKDAAGNAASVTHKATFHSGVTGIVFVVGDEAKRVAGAMVSLLGKDVVTDETGAFAIEVDPGEGVLVVKANGYTTAREALTVPADRRVAAKVGMVAGTDTPGTQAQVVFYGPVDGVEVTLPKLHVTGAVSGFEVANVEVNGTRAALQPGGRFAITVPLQVGFNEIEAVAHGVGGETVKGTLTVKRALGKEFTPPAPVLRGCSVSGGAAFGLLALLRVVRRRRSR